MGQLGKALVAGYAVLLVAIGMNGLATAVGITTWYGFFDDTSVGIADSLFLFAIYPICLGIAGLVGAWLAEQLGAIAGGKQPGEG